MAESIVPGVPGRYPARAGGPWLCSTLVLFLFQPLRDRYWGQGAIQARCR